MWPWRRNRAKPADPPPARPVGQWRQVAPIQRTVAGSPLVNPVERFSSSLASWQDPRFLAPLGHGIGAGEPSGVIGDFARPAEETGQPLPDLPVVTVARATRRALPVPTLASGGSASTAGAVVQRSATVPQAAVTSPAPVAPSPAVLDEPTSDLGATADPVPEPADAQAPPDMPLPAASAAPPDVPLPAASAVLPDVSLPAASAAPPDVPLAVAPASAHGLLPAAPAPVQRAITDSVPAHDVVRAAGPVAPPPGPLPVAGPGAGKLRTESSVSVGPAAEVVSAHRPPGASSDPPPGPVVQRSRAAEPDFTPAPAESPMTGGVFASDGSGPAASTVDASGTATAISRVTTDEPAASGAPVVEIGDDVAPTLGDPTSGFSPVVGGEPVASGAETTGGIEPVAGGHPAMPVSARPSLPGTPTVQRVTGQDGHPTRPPRPDQTPLTGSGSSPLVSTAGTPVQRTVSTATSPSPLPGPALRPATPDPAPAPVPAAPIGPVAVNPPMAVPPEPAPVAGEETAPQWTVDQAGPVVQRMEGVAPSLGSTYRLGLGAPIDPAQSFGPPTTAASATPTTAASAAATAAGSGAATLPTARMSRPLDQPPTATAAVQRSSAPAPHNETPPRDEAPPREEAPLHGAAPLRDAGRPGSDDLPVQRTLPLVPPTVIEASPKSLEQHGGRPDHELVVARLVGDRPLTRALDGPADRPPDQNPAPGVNLEGLGLPLDPNSSRSTPVPAQVVQRFAGPDLAAAVPVRAAPAPWPGPPTSAGPPLTPASPGQLGAAGPLGSPGPLVSSGTLAPVAQLLPVAAAPVPVAAPARSDDGPPPAAAAVRFDVPAITVSRQVAEPAAEPTAPDAQATTSGAPAGPAGVEPEELLKKLFDPLLRRLKAELRLDRERRGSLTDLRR